MLPGSRTILVHRWGSFDPEEAEIVALDLETGSPKTVLPDATDPHYVETGELLFMRLGRLWAVPFDLERLETRGQGRIVLEDVMHSVGMPSGSWETGAAQLAISRSGHLAYASGGVYPAFSTELISVGFDGEAEPLDLRPQDYLPPRVSPEGDRLAYGLRSGWRQSYYVWDLIRRFQQPLNAGGYYNEWPIWSPDGDTIALASDRDGPRNLYRLPADGTGKPERLAPSDKEQQPSSWSSEGVLAYLEDGDIWVLPPGRDPTSFFTSPEEERYPTFSHDGQWIAYTSEELGSEDWELYVRPYPGPGRPVRLSAGHVESPAWSRDDRRVYYLEGLGDRHRMMVVDVTQGDPVEVGPAVPFIDPWPYDRFQPVRGYDLLTDSSFVALLNGGPQALTDEASALGVGLTMWRYKVGELHVIRDFEELRVRGGG
jgi:serine/threonine-protein kinase